VPQTLYVAALPERGAPHRSGMTMPRQKIVEQKSTRLVAGEKGSE